MLHPLIPWKRFWCPLGGIINSGDDGLGFLSDPEGVLGKLANPNVSPLLKLLPDTGPIVLCGEPGIGKSTELQGVRALLQKVDEDYCVWLPFREIADSADFRHRTVGSPTWQQWRSGGARLTLVVDGVDEGLLRVPNFLNDLTTLLRDEPIRRLRLLLACRTAEWPVETGRSLIGLWSSHKFEPVYELCPLRRADVETAARSWNCDPAGFIDVIWDRSVAGLAARPVTLFFLLGEYARHAGLPASHRELYERGTINLVREGDPARVEILRALRMTTVIVSDTDRLHAAQRLAALLLLCGRSAVRRSRALFEPEIDLDLSLETAEGTQPPPVTLSALDEAVESALFTSLGERRFGFAHQTFAECLAAQDMRRIAIVQLRRLLCRRDGRGEHVIPQLAELAAWVAGIHPAFCEHVLTIEPQILLRSDVTRLQGTLKARLVDAVLNGAREERIFDSSGFGRFLSGLSHPGLGVQLLPWISAPTEHHIARRIAFNIAEKCRVTALIDPLLAVVTSTAETHGVRARAMGALEDIVPDDRVALFEPFARGEVAEDVDDAFKGCALRRLVPKHWKVRDVLPYLTPRKNGNYIGTYTMFLHHDLPRALEDDDLPQVLVWLRPEGNFGRSRSIGQKLGEAAFARALHLLVLPPVATEVAATWHAWANRYELHQLPQDSEIRKILTHNEGIRRQLTILFLNHPGTEPDDISCLLHPIPVLRGADSLDWLLDQLPAAPIKRRTAWVAAISSLARDFQVQAGCWDKLLARINQIPELAENFDWLRSWSLDETCAIDAKACWQRDKERQAEFAQFSREQAPEPKKGITEAFAAFSSGNSQAWVHLWHHLILGENGEEQWQICDVATCVNWELLTPSQKSSAPEIARTFLLSDARTADHTTGACCRQCDLDGARNAR